MPSIKFVSVPYHLNVSIDGMICNDIIGKGYNSSLHILDIIQNIKQMLFTQNIESAIRFDAYDIFMNNHDKFEKLALESTQKNAKNNYKDYLESSKIYDDVPTFNFEEDESDD